MKETRNQKFKRLAEKRTNRIIHDLRLLGNLSGANYEWDKKDVNKIFKEIGSTAEMANLRFNKRSSEKFTLDIPVSEPVRKIAKIIVKRISHSAKPVDAPAKKTLIERCDNCFENRPTQLYRGINLCKRDFRKRKMIYKIRKANGSKRSFVK